MLPGDRSGSCPSATALPAHVLMAGADTVYFSFDVTISEAMRAKLVQEKEAARVAAKAGQVHCPDWLSARVLPNGARGG
jgi:hypothetical protein